MRRSAATVLFCGAFSFLSPAFGAQTKLLPPVVTDASVDVGSASTEDLSLTLKLEVENPNAVSVQIEQVKAEVTVQGIDPISLKSNETVVLKPKSKTKYKIPLDLPWKSALAVSAKVFEKKPIPYHVKGTAKVGGKETPFDHNGTLPTH